MAHIGANAMSDIEHEYVRAAVHTQTRQCNIGIGYKC